MCADRCLVWGMRREPKNADAWDVGGGTELTVPSAAIVYRDEKNEREPGASKSTTKNRELDGSKV